MMGSREYQILDSVGLRWNQSVVDHGCGGFGSGRGQWLIKVRGGLRSVKDFGQWYNQGSGAFRSMVDSD
jgi:hypothetical protein